MSIKTQLKSLAIVAGVTATTAMTFASAVASAEGEVNVYSARKEELIKPLLDKFAEANDVEVNLITGNYGDLQKRLEVEGEAGPADVYITVDAGRLVNAKEAGLFQAIDSDYVTENVGEHFIDPDNQWVSLSVRARPAFYSLADFDPSQIETYADLAGAAAEGELCIRSSTNIYNQSLVASLIENEGEEFAQNWAEGVVNNMARPPAGGDTDQIRGVASGVCDLAVANHYYYARLATSDNAEDNAVAEKVGVLWLNQGEDQRGNHINVSGAGITKSSKNVENATALIEYLLSEEAQEWYADTNNEYPVLDGVTIPEQLAALGDFKADDLNLSALGENNRQAVEIMDKAGWK